MTTRHDKRSSSEPAQNSTRPVALAWLLFVPLMLLGCPSGANKPGSDSSVTPARSEVKPASDFVGERAFEHVRKQVEFGPRPAGSAELEKTRNYIIDQLKSYGLKVTTDELDRKSTRLNSSH